MSESARPFDDSLGDASGVAPYDDTSLAGLISSFGDFVIPEPLTTTTSPLVVTGDAGAGAGNVLIAPGKAWVVGTLYVNDAPLALVPDAAVNNRIDYVVLRRDSAAQTVRATLIKGVEAANPSPPGLTANDLALAWVWLPAGHTPAAIIATTNIHDERVFLPTGEQAAGSSNVNLMPNSEFLAYSGSAAGNVNPELWRNGTVAPNVINGAAQLTNQPRGRSVRIQAAGANEGIRIGIRIAPGWYTIRGTVNITSGGVYITAQPSLGGVTNTQYFYRTGANIDFLMRVYAQTGQQILDIFIHSAGAGDFKVGQILVTQGFNPGYFRHKHELIMLDTPLTDASWTATAKSTGTTLIDLSASFGGLFGAAQPIRGVLLRLRGNDSASGGASDAAHMYTSLNGATTPLSFLRIGRVANDKIRDIIAFAPMIGGLGNTFYLGVKATGAGTFDATVEIIGIIT